MRAATTHSSGTTLFTFTALKCAITPILEVASYNLTRRPTHAVSRMDCGALHSRTCGPWRCHAMPYAPNQLVLPL